MHSASRESPSNETSGEPPDHVFDDVSADVPAERTFAMPTSTAPRQGTEIIERVRALAPSIRSASDEIEKTGRLTDEIVHGLTP